MLSLTFPFPSPLPFAGLWLSCGRVAVDVGLAASVLLRFAFRFLSVPRYDCVLAARRARPCVWWFNAIQVAVPLRGALANTLPPQEAT